MSAGVASSQQSFLINILTSTQKPRRKLISYGSTISCGYSKQESDDHHMLGSSSSRERSERNHLAKFAMVALAAGVLTFGSVDDALAGKSGGRIGGQAFRSSGPRVSAPRGNSRTNIYINPPVAPPLVGGYGYGYGVPFYGGWGWSPFSFFVPGPSVAVGIGGGLDLLALFLFIGAISAVIRRFIGSRNEEEED
ncbi:hypothetical protein SAY87_023310 [Trapa incisa]|uniref:Uncharacterized protein n=1 Tax=Trapa incisa TaxID=236973 RepID=A0AAN7K5I9_9MYRT|nr:hypothetical protein SAY87_023310 [Trapa incisa]